MVIVLMSQTIKPETVTHGDVHLKVPGRSNRENTNSTSLRVMPSLNTQLFFREMRLLHENSNPPHQ